MHADSIRQCSRPSKGVKVMRLTGESKVVAVACVPREEEHSDIEETKNAESHAETEETN